ncbi:MAG: PKD domain-containing protein [Dehalococcoidia bacterium]|nr:PKD domain-containing protein [Dehalococcoidia bacterium]
MESSKNNYEKQDERGGGSSEVERRCAFCNRPIRPGQTYYYCRRCGKGPLCNNHCYGDDGCVFCNPKTKKGFPKWGIALIAIAVVAIGIGVVHWTNPPVYYTLTTDVSPSGSGSISPSSSTYEAGETVSLTAHPGSGYEFDYWGGDASGSSNPTSIKMYGNKHVVAHFKVKNGNHAPGDPSSPSGPSSGYIGTSYTYSTSATDPDGDQVKYTFDWDDGTTSETGFVSSGSTTSKSHSWSNPGTYYVKAKATDSHGASSGWSSLKSVTITETNFRLTTSVSPPGSGSVSPSSGTYQEGMTVSLTAHANSGYVFDHWGGDASGSSSSVSINMDSNKHVTAYFEEVPPQRIILDMGGCIPGISQYRIKFSCYLDAGEQVEGFVEWDHEYFSGWSFDVLDPEGNVIPIDESGTNLHWDFSFTASHAGEYTIRMINRGDIYRNTGVMEIRPRGWRQTEY